MEILIAAVVLGLIVSKIGPSRTENRVRGRRLSDEVHPLVTILMGIL